MSLFAGAGDREIPSMRSVQSVERVLQTVFPRGTTPLRDGSIVKMPILPTDVFAGVGILIEYSGIYHRLKPAELSTENTTAGQKIIRHLATQNNKKPRPITAGDIIESGPKYWVTLGKAWRGNSSFYGPVSLLWNEIIKERLQSVVSLEKRPAELTWLKAALALFAICDEACEGLGYVDGNWIDFAFQHSQSKPKAEIIDKNHPSHLRSTAKDGSMCVLADENVVCVMPKSRTPMVGCTLRAMSHNLALLPPPHKASAFWYRPPLKLEKNTKPLNILLVPFPYQIDARDFTAIEMEGSYAPEFDRWGEFELRQSWLQKAKVPSLIEELLEAGTTKGTTVEGVVFPEFSLDWRTYSDLVETLRKPNYKSVRFLISGSSEDGTDGDVKKGNFVLTTMFYDDPKGGERVAVTSARGKHHRWRLNGSQVESYCLDNVLDANTFWWENIDLTERRISSTVFRESSVFTTLICEDLARSEPVHSVLQSIGPNLVFVLLMDGPQLKDRWAARNATGLAEDPGSSVLTFTCRALLHRQSERVDGYPPNYTIALWKDDSQRIREIKCEPGLDAVIVTLSAARAKETTLDGRANSDAWAWRMSGYIQIKRNAT